MDASGTTYCGGDHLHLGGVDDANIAGSTPGGRPCYLRQRSAGVEDQHRNAGTNSGRPVDAGQVLALSSGCAVMSVATTTAAAASTAAASTAAVSAVILVLQNRHKNKQHTTRSRDEFPYSFHILG